MRSAAAYAALARDEGARADRRRARRPHPFAECSKPRWSAASPKAGSTSCGSAWARRPMLYFATHHLDVDGGIQVTGSHNPADYNGFKMLLNGRSVFGAGDPGARPARRRAATGARAAARSRKSTSAKPMSTAWSQDFSGKPFRIGWDAGNGAAGPILDMLVERLPGQHHAIFTEVDGTFPNHHPDPTVESQPRRPEAARRRQAASTSASPSTATATASARSTARAA